MQGKEIPDDVWEEYQRHAFPSLFNKDKSARLIYNQEEIKHAQIMRWLHRIIRILQSTSGEKSLCIDLWTTISKYDRSEEELRREEEEGKEQAGSREEESMKLLRLEAEYVDMIEGLIINLEDSTLAIN